MRVVLDTNVLIAALISRGFCYELLEHCVLTHTLVTSDFILTEVGEKLSDKFNYSAEIADEAVALLRSQMQLVTPAALLSRVSRDVDDDNILATAVAGKCDCIITGDNDLLVLTQYEGIKIFRPREFLDNEKTE